MQLKCYGLIEVSVSEREIERDCVIVCACERDRNSGRSRYFSSGILKKLHFFSVRTYVLGKNLICDYREIIFDSNSPIFFNNCFSLIFVSLEFLCLGIRAAWDRRNEFQITESVQYYFNKIDSIKMPNYIPDKVSEENEFIFVFLLSAF